MYHFTQKYRCTIIKTVNLNNHCYSVVVPQRETAHLICSVQNKMFSQPINYLQMKWVWLESSSRICTPGLQRRWGLDLRHLIITVICWLKKGKKKKYNERQQLNMNYSSVLLLLAVVLLHLSEQRHLSACSLPKARTLHVNAVVEPLWLDLTATDACCHRPRTGGTISSLRFKHEAFADANCRVVDEKPKCQICIPRSEKVSNTPPCCHLRIAGQVRLIHPPAWMVTTRKAACVDKDLFWLSRAVCSDVDHSY